MLRPSPRLAWAASAGHALAGLAVWLSALPAGVCTALSALVLVGWLQQWRRARLLGRRQVRRLKRGADGWRLTRDDGVIAPAVLLPRRTLVTPQLMILCFRVPGRRRSLTLLLPPDALAPASFRRLRVELKWAE